MTAPDRAPLDAPAPPRRRPGRCGPYRLAGLRGSAGRAAARATKSVHRRLAIDSQVVLPLPYLQISKLKAQVSRRLSTPHTVSRENTHPRLDKWLCTSIADETDELADSNQRDAYPVGTMVHFVS